MIANFSKLVGLTAILSAASGGHVCADQITYTAIELPTLGGGSTSAAAINAGNQVTGSSTTTNDTYQAFLYSNGTPASTAAVKSRAI